MPSDIAIGIVGIGNVLTGDDGFGPFLVSVLEATYEFPEGVEVKDLGTPGLNLLSELADYDDVIVVDTVNATGPAGEVRVYDGEELMRLPEPMRMSPHEPTLTGALKTVGAFKARPQRCKLIGVIPEGTELASGLSEPVRAATDAAVDAVLNALEAWGVKPKARERALAPAVWWEAA